MKDFNIWTADCVEGPNCRNPGDRRGQEQSKQWMLANSGCPVSDTLNSLFQLVWGLKILKSGNKFGIRIFDLRYGNSTFTSTYLLHMHVPELGYKPFKSKCMIRMGCPPFLGSMLNTGVQTQICDTNIMSKSVCVGLMNTTGKFHQLQYVRFCVIWAFHNATKEKAII